MTEIIKSILIVDNDRNEMELLGSIFGEDYRLMYALNGRKALEIYAQRKPSLVLVDVGAPEINGLFLIDELRKSSQIPIIAVSGIDSNSIEKALEIGANSAFLKPFKVSEVVMNVRKLIKEPK